MKQSDYCHKSTVHRPEGESSKYSYVVKKSCNRFEYPHIIHLPDAVTPFLKEAAHQLGLLWACQFLFQSRVRQ